MNTELEALLQDARKAALRHNHRTQSFGEYRRMVWAEALKHVRELFPKVLQPAIQLEVSDSALPGVFVRGHVTVFAAVDLLFVAINRGMIDYLNATHRWELRPTRTFTVESRMDRYETDDLLLALAKAEEWQLAAQSEGECAQMPAQGGDRRHSP